MTMRSMTGIGTAEVVVKAAHGARVTVEIRSVNSKHVDVRVRASTRPKKHPSAG